MDTHSYGAASEGHRSQLKELSIAKNNSYNNKNITPFEKSKHVKPLTK